MHLETVVPTAADVAALALHALLDELSSLRAPQIERMASVEAGWSARVAVAQSEAMAALAAADRLAPLESATVRLAAVCIGREIPQPARAAAYAALLGLIASDLLPHATFRVLYEGWEAGLGGRGASSVIINGEEVLLHIE
jgi:hypothetical protein